MGLHHLFQSATNEGKNANTTDTQIASADNDPVQAFYVLAEQDYHKAAAGIGYAKHGIIRVAELMPLGRRAVQAFLKNEAYQKRYGSEPDDYYYIIFSLCIQIGAVLAFQWQNDYAGLQADGAGRLIKEGPSTAAAEIFSNILQLDRREANRFFRKIYTRWRILMSPYWELGNAKDFTYFSMLAAFQLGISMVLDQYNNQ